MADNRQLARFHALLKEAGALANKFDVLASVGVASAKYLTDAQCDTLCAALSKMVAAKNTTDADLRRKRSHVLALCTDLGAWDGRDWGKLNAFMRQKRIAGKLLPECSMEELNELVIKLRMMLTKKAADKEVQIHQAQWN